MSQNASKEHGDGVAGGGKEALDYRPGGEFVVSRGIPTGTQLVV